MQSALKQLDDIAGAVRSAVEKATTRTRTTILAMSESLSMPEASGEPLAAKAEVAAGLADALEVMQELGRVQAQTTFKLGRVRALAEEEVCDATATLPWDVPPKRKPAAVGPRWQPVRP
jgi:hypothetical protein